MEKSLSGTFAAINYPLKDFALKNYLLQVKPVRPLTL